MRLSSITIQGFKSFAKKTTIDVTHQVTGVVGPNGSGKSNIAEAIRFVLGEQSIKSMRGKQGTDVIFKGSEHLAPLGRARVEMHIDNKEKINTENISQDLAPFLVYDEIILSRTIYADGSSDYMLNDAKVRLKDVQELLSFAGIGGSSHTIINQGEADKILLASPKDRKEALEDALGLKVYNMRLSESKRKLEKVKISVHEVELLRKEIRPHLLNLENKWKKIEDGKNEREKLKNLIINFLNIENRNLEELKSQIKEKGSSSSLNIIKESIEKELNNLKETKEDTSNVDEEKDNFIKKIEELSLKKEQVVKFLGRLEYTKESIEKSLTQREQKGLVLTYDELNKQKLLISSIIDNIKRFINEEDKDSLKKEIINLESKLDEVFGGKTASFEDKEKKKELEETLKEIASYLEKETEIKLSISDLEEKIRKIEEERKRNLIRSHEEEKNKLNLEAKLRELSSLIMLRRQEEGEYDMRKNRFDSLFSEGEVILGKGMINYLNIELDKNLENKNKEDLLRLIERSKLKIEELNIIQIDETIKEYNEVKSRDEYLTKELKDIKESEEKLTLLIKDLNKTLEEKFSSGIKEVSKIFGEFFGEIFINGKAKVYTVDLIKEDDDGNKITEVGVDIDVSLPNKKVKELSMFSGGERALVSIALLFAMSQVTPPPFMVLDETDAPLDESNARKYGGMLARLAEKSKLLVITHNRETMNHCDMLYGVTLGIDGGSKLLSINLKDL